MLVSYHYMKDEHLSTQLPANVNLRPELFLDSGAFTAYTQGTPISMDNYCDYIKKHHEVISWYANLDILGDAEATWQNQRKMEARGLNPVPVFHVGEPWSYLERYIKEYSYVGLGGLVPYKTMGHKVMPWLIKCFRMAEGEECVYHGFGLTIWECIHALPFYSVDSTTWLNGQKFGKTKMFDPVRRRLFDLDVGTTHPFRYGNLIREHGFEPEDFADETRNTYAANQALAALNFHEAERYLRKRHGLIRHPDGDPDTEPQRATTKWNRAVDGVHEPGIKVFFAASSLKAFNESSQTIANLHV